MKPEFEEISLIDNTVEQRFELHVNSFVAFIDYEKNEDGILSLIHTEAPAELAGTGAAAALVEKTLIFAEKEKLEILPFCPFVYAYIKKHPEWKRIVNETFPAYNRI